VAIDVFVSYSHYDQKLVDCIVAFLEKDFVVWWDSDLVSGTKFSDDIFAKITRVPVVLVIWSHSSAQARWVEKESTAALGNSTVIPVMLDDAPRPAHLAALDSIDLRNWDGVSVTSELSKLSQDIRLRIPARKASGYDVARTQIPSRKLVFPDGNTILSGVVFYLVGMILSLYHVNSNDPYNKLSLLSLCIINIPFLILLVRHRQYLYVRNILKLAVIGMTWGGITIFGSAACVAVLGIVTLIFSTDWRMTSQMDEARRKSKYVYNLSTCIDLSIIDLQKSSPEFTKRGRKLDKEVTSLNPHNIFKPLSSEERYLAVGCATSDWKHVITTSAERGLEKPPFIIDLDPANKWASQVRTLLEQDKFDDARLVLLNQPTSDTAASNLVGVLDALGLGEYSDGRSSFMRFRDAAMKGNTIAQGNMAIMYLFGFQTVLDPQYGTKLFEDALQKGVKPEVATFLLSTGVNRLQVTDFAEVIKTIHLESTKGSAVAKAIEGVFASIGLAKDPCAPSCAELASKIAKELSGRGERFLGYLVDLNANKEADDIEKRKAVPDLPAVFTILPSEEYDAEVQVENAGETLERPRGGGREIFRGK
jgi:hypothetical protein